MSEAKSIIDTRYGASVETPQENYHELTLDEAIEGYIHHDQEIKRHAGERRECLARLLPEAFELRGAQNTVRLETNDKSQRIKFEFKSAFKCDVDQLNTAKEMLGDDVFEGLFKTEYSPRLRSLRPFLSSKSSDERAETAREIIRGAMKPQELSPTVSVEAS